MTEAPTTLLAPMASFPDGAVVRLGLDRVVGSSTNPRKTFNADKLAELAENIKASGVHSPILVRPLPGSRLQDTYASRKSNESLPEFEIVYGERRYRASRLAGVQDVPVVVRNLTDDQVLDIQITENLQRDDLLPLEEAEGYQTLMNHSKLTAEQVGAKIGKSKAYVYSKLKLLDLCMPARDALRAGTIDASKALLLARIPNEKLQLKALKELTDKDYYGQPMSYRRAAELVQSEYMLKLTTARFRITDAALLPKAGACSSCPKRTGHEPDLFADVKGADVCTDPTCFREKEALHSTVVVDQARAKGQTLIAGKEAQELVTSGYQAKFKGYRRLDDNEDSPTSEPLRKIIGAHMKADGVEPVMIEHPRNKGTFVATLANDVVLRLLKKAEADVATTNTVAKEVQQFADDKKAKAVAKAKDKYERGWRKNLLDRTWELLKDGSTAVFTLDVHRFLAIRAVANLSTEETEALAEALGVGKVGAHSALREYAQETASPDLLHLLVIALRDSGPGSASYEGGNRAPNVGLMLVAGAAFGSRLTAVIASSKAAAEDEFMPKTREPKADLPPGSAAQAKGGVGGNKGKGKKKTAAPASGIPKTSKEYAATQIADAFQALEGETPGSADAPQSDDAVPVLRQAPETMPAVADDVEGTGSGAAIAAQGDEGQAVLRQPGGDASPFSIGQGVRFKDGLRNAQRQMRKICGRDGVIESGKPDEWVVRIGAKVHQIATATDAEIFPLASPSAEDVLLYRRVQVNANARGPGQKQFVGRTGYVYGRSGSSACLVSLDFLGGSVFFDATELDEVAA